MGQRDGRAAHPEWHPGTGGMLPIRSGGADPAPSADGATLSSSSASHQTTGPGGGVLTLGVEEEFLLVDRTTGAAVPYAPAVVSRAAEEFGAERIQAELFPTQIETASRPCTSLADLRADLRLLRQGIARHARAAGCLPMAGGTAVLPAATEVPVTDTPRYRRLADHFRPIAEAQAEGVCGCHVHVGIADREEAVQVANALRPWLPTLEALAANSPYHHGRDTGYASTRILIWSRWPTAGPTPHFTSAKAYDDLVDALVDSGMLLDRKMVYWHARLSEHYPTLEIRVADVNADLDTVLLFAALVRGLCGTLLAEIRAGRSFPPVGDSLLRAAHWRAARDGLEGQGLDLFSGRLLPAGELLQQLVRYAGPGLEEAGDHATVADLLRRLQHSGGGAAQQRTAFARRGRFQDVVEHLTALTGAAGA
ncbi:carboxylate-amine ligase [Streptacidiphilus griseoplanus]|uniref:carboxylate-amine ligase n=1 Tax=Peterkaempfera griseoplana TaxID=66896 RepID=UPI000AE028F2|nr:glutamate--cysteine ligase [Peterkaempfera griseoplana]